MASIATEVKSRDWTQLINELDETENKRHELAKNEDKVMIDSIRVKSKKMLETSAFESIERVFHFWIDTKQDYQTSKPLPKLNLADKRRVDLDLEIGFDECSEKKGLIDDYCGYRDIKWQYFLKSIKDNDLLDKYNPQFVAFGGPIADTMATVYDTSSEWRLAAEKINDVIYIFKIRNERVRGEYFRGKALKRSYSGLKFLHLVTEGYDNQMNEFEKCFSINCIDFVGHKILSLNELDAIDDDNKPVYINLAQSIRSAKDHDFFHRKKLLRFWSKASVQGIDRLVIGNIEHNNYLLDIEQRKVEDIPEDCANKWSDIHCLDFLNRFFQFMKDCITEEHIVYDFNFRSGEEYVVCHRIHPKRRSTILPPFYNQS